MRLLLNDSKVAFTVTKAAEPKTEFGGTQQKVDRATKRPGVGGGGARHGFRARGGDPGHGDW